MRHAGVGQQGGGIAAGDLRGRRAQRGADDQGLLVEEIGAGDLVGELRAAGEELVGRRRAGRGEGEARAADPRDQRKAEIAQARDHGGQQAVADVVAEHVVDQVEATEHDAIDGQPGPPHFDMSAQPFNEFAARPGAGHFVVAGEIGEAREMGAPFGDVSKREANHAPARRGGYA